MSDRPRLLVVEDEPRLAALLSRGLTAEGYQVDITHDGVSALERASREDYRALVLDRMLPRMDGLEVCRRLRAAGSPTRVLMLTARVDLKDRVTGLDAGADDYLVKPFAMVELVARLRALLRRDPVDDHGAPQLLRVGDLELDPGAREVTRAGQPVALSTREFDLLALLARHPNQVLTREAILDHVWDTAHTGDAPASNVVDQYVAYLRRKLDRPFGRDDIQTVRGIGYRLRVRPPAPEARPG